MDYPDPFDIFIPSFKAGPFVLRLLMVSRGISFSFLLRAGVCFRSFLRHLSDFFCPYMPTKSVIILQNAVFMRVIEV